VVEADSAHYRVVAGVNNQVHSTDHARVDVLPRDITTLPHVLGSDLIEYLATASMGTPGRPDLWDPFTEAADVIDAGLWYTTSFDATPERSVTRWLPPDRSRLATVAVYSQGSDTAVLIRHKSPGRSNRRW
jgi:hypothetical protein